MGAACPSMLTGKVKDIAFRLVTTFWWSLSLGDMQHSAEEHRLPCIRVSLCPLTRPALAQLYRPGQLDSVGVCKPDSLKMTVIPLTCLTKEDPEEA